MTSTLDLKHAGLIVSAGAAVSLRFLSDFSFATIQDQAARASLDLGRVGLASYGAVVLSTLGYELHRDWFNLSPQAPFEVTGLIVVLVAAYTLLRRTVGPPAAAAAVLLTTPFVPLLTILSACAWVLLRAARAA